MHFCGCDARRRSASLRASRDMPAVKIGKSGRSATVAPTIAVRRGVTTDSQSVTYRATFDMHVPEIRSFRV